MTIKSARILIIEPDSRTAGELTSALENCGFVTEWATDTLDALKKLTEMSPDLIIMTSGLPQVRGEDPCLRVRQASYLPMIMTGTRDETLDLLDMGADAFMKKPLNKREMVARVRSLLRRKWQENNFGR